MRASTHIRALGVALGAIFIAVACGSGATSGAGTVHVIAVWSGINYHVQFFRLWQLRGSPG